MKGFLSTFLLVAMISQWAKADCRDYYRSQKKHLSDSAPVIEASVTTSGLGMVIVLPILAAASAIRGIQNGPQNRMIRLIGEAEDYMRTGSSKHKRLLKKLRRRAGDYVSLGELADAIVEGNEDGTLCKQNAHVRDLRKELRSGDIKILKVIDWSI